MEDDRIPKDLLWATGKRPTGRPQLRFKDIYKRDLKALAINTDTWEALACDRMMCLETEGAEGSSLVSWDRRMPTTA